MVWPRCPFILSVFSIQYIRLPNLPMSVVLAGHSLTLVRMNVSFFSAATTHPCSVTVEPLSYFFPSACCAVAVIPAVATIAPASPAAVNNFCMAISRLTDLHDACQNLYLGRLRLPPPLIYFATDVRAL